MNAAVSDSRRAALSTARLAGSWLTRALASFALCAFACLPAQAKLPMRFDRLGLEQGLSQQAANTMIQDPTGFLWIGTEDGLNRYDGYGIEHVRRIRSHADSLPENFIADIELDSSGKMWVATDGGGLVQQGSGERDFHSVPGVTMKGLERIRVIRFDSSGRLWIGSREDGLAAFDPEHRVLARWRHESGNADSLAGNSIYTLFEDHHRYLWVGTDAGLDRLDLKTQSLEHIPLQFLAGGERVPVRTVLEDQSGVIWVGTESGLIRHDPRGGLQRVYRHNAADPRTLPSDSVNVLHEDRAGRLWIGTSDGLALYDTVADSFDIYRNEPADPASLPDSHIVSIFEDRSGLLWVGTKFGGIGKWNPRTWSFGHHLAGAAEGMVSHNLTAFTEDRTGRLWIATLGGGITIVDRSRGAATVLRHDSSAANGLSDDRVMALLTDSQGVIWAGTMSGGLNRIDPQTREVRVYHHDPADPRTLGAPGVMSLLEDKAHQLWVGTYGGGLSRLDRSSGVFQRYLPEPDNPLRLAGGRVTALAQDTNGRIWVGTDGAGLHVLHPSSDRFYRFRRDPRDPASLSSDTIYALHVDASGTVWVGTRGGGLDRVKGSSKDPRQIRFDNFSESEGLPNNTIYGIHSDSHGDLWLSTNYGLARLDPRTGAVRVFHSRNGLQAEEFNFGAHYRSRRDELFFGGANGYNAFEPSRLQWNDYAPPVVLTSVLSGNEHLSRLALERGPLQLPHHHDLVTFEFAALDFSAPEANAFQYQLEGFKGAWLNAGNQRRVSYSNLPGGQYTLRVRAANADGTLNPRGLAFAFSVAPPPWASAVAYISYAIALLMMVFAIWFWRRRKHLREALYTRRLEEDVLNRTRELAARNAELERMNERLETASFSDPLTGLGNRRSLGHAMPTLIARVKPRVDTCDPEHMILMLVDLDRLKPINDEFGHEAGDRLLAGVSSILLDCVRSTDKVVRWGGDEFVIVSAPLSFDEAAGLAERIRASVSRRRFPIANSKLARTSCSIGFACYPFVADDPYLLSWEQTLNIADMALYRAKARRNTWIGWSGTRNAAGVSDLPGLLAANPLAAVSSGLVEARTCAPTSDETIEQLLTRKCS